MLKVVKVKRQCCAWRTYLRMMTAFSKNPYHTSGKNSHGHGDGCLQAERREGGLWQYDSYVDNKPVNDSNFARMQQDAGPGKGATQIAARVFIQYENIRVSLECSQSFLQFFPNIILFLCFSRRWAWGNCGICWEAYLPISKDFRMRERMWFREVVREFVIQVFNSRCLGLGCSKKIYVSVSSECEYRGLFKF